MASMAASTGYGLPYVKSARAYLRLDKLHYYTSRQTVAGLVIASVPGVTFNEEDVVLFIRGGPSK